MAKLEPIEIVVTTTTDLSNALGARDAFLGRFFLLVFAAGAIVGAALALAIREVF